MWPSTDDKIPQPSQTENTQPPAASPETPGTPVRAANSATQNQHSLIGKSIVIKGEISSTDPVYVYGRVEGTIKAPAHRVTIGREGNVKANIHAREIVIMGTVSGKLESSERAEIRTDGTLTGDLSTRRVYIEDGAVLNGKIDVSRPKEPEAREEVQTVVEMRKIAPEPEHDVERETWADLAVSEIA